MAHSIDPALAHQYFEEADELFRRDEGALWGISLAGPLIFVDLQTRDAVANRPDAENRLAEHERVYIGTIPPQVMVANTALSWAGVHWTMVLWQSVPQDPSRRASLIAHESFHRVQAEIGLPPTGPPTANAHMDTFVGRYWVQLEWRALARALAARGEGRIAAMGDALVFRAHRRSLCPDAYAEEQALEMHEGLAEYTGVKLGRGTVEDVVERLRTGPVQYPSFVRSFAYLSGPAYGLLLDALVPAWRCGLAPSDDLGALLQARLGLSLPDDLSAAADERALDYDGPSLRSQEMARDHQRLEVVARYRARLLDHSVLILPITPEVQCAFDPRTTTPIPGVGSVFPSIHVSEAWGVLEVEEGGLLMHADWRTAHIAPPTHRSPHLSGDGWRLDLAEGWTMKPGERSGDLLITRA